MIGPRLTAADAVNLAATLAFERPANDVTRVSRGEHAAATRREGRAIVSALHALGLADAAEAMADHMGRTLGFDARR